MLLQQKQLGAYGNFLITDIVRVIYEIPIILHINER